MIVYKYTTTKYANGTRYICMRHGRPWFSQTDGENSYKSRQ